MTIRDIRNFIFGLRPQLLSGTTLINGLVAVVEEFRHNSISTSSCTWATSTRSPTRATGHLLGVVNEALNNIARHSGASRATASLSSRTGLPGPRLEDMATGSTRRRSASSDIRAPNMRSRMAAIGGTLDVTSDATATRVHVHRRSQAGSTGEWRGMTEERLDR